MIPEVMSRLVLDPDLAAPSHLCWAWPTWEKINVMESKFFLEYSFMYSRDTKPEKKSFWPYRHFKSYMYCSIKQNLFIWYIPLTVLF